MLSKTLVFIFAILVATAAAAAAAAAAASASNEASSYPLLVYCSVVAVEGARPDDSGAPITSRLRRRKLETLI